MSSIDKCHIRFVYVFQLGTLGTNIDATWNLHDSVMYKVMSHRICKEGALLISLKFNVEAVMLD